MSDRPRHTPGTTVAEATRLVADHVPALAGEPVERLGAGTDHDAFVVGGRYVLRVPRHEDGALHLASEARLTGWLADRLPIAVPRYELLAAPSPRAPRGVAGYRMLPGRPALGIEVDPAAIGARLGEILAVLHAADVAQATALGVPADDDPTRAEWSAVALSDLRFARDHGHLAPDQVARWERALEVTPPAGGRACLVHGDLAAEHVLVDDRSSPTGIIDWSDACVGDPARDLAGLVHWGGLRMVSAAREGYGPIDEALLARARWLAACRAFADVVFGTTHDRPDYVRAGLRALALQERSLA